ncbi:MAG: DUF4136 domain-containing protein [Maribacter sp.]|nr:DUF4136 domain-containing protein [Maribacter sp.]
MKYLLALMVVLLMVSCNAIRVNYDYDEETDFSAYTTYHYYADMETGLSELDLKRLLGAMDIALQTKGLLFSEEPDMWINIKSNTFRTQPNNTVGVGVGGTGRSVGGGVSIGIPVGQANLQREIQFDFVDAKKNMLFWQASSSSSFKENALPIERERMLKELVDKVLAKYPPKRKI